MKKLLYLIFVVAVAFYGCKKGENTYPPPTIQFITNSDFVQSDTTMKLGESFKIGVNANNPNANLTNLIIKIESDVIETFLDSGMNSPSLNFERTLVKGIKDTEKWIFIIRDRNGNSSEVSLNIYKDTSSSFGEILYHENISLGAQNSSLAEFYSIPEDSVYLLNSAFENQNKIDMCYYYDFIDTDENTIASPGANIDPSVYQGSSGLSNWTTRRTTRYKVANITEDDFYNATNDSILIATYGQSDGNRKAKNLQNGNIFSFKNEDGKIGMFLVNSVEGSDSGAINISIKVQE